MPLYEFYCKNCHTVYTFRSQRVDTVTVPECPDCGGKLSRQVSSFSHIVKSGDREDLGGFDRDEISQAEQEELISKMGRRLDAMNDDDADPAEAVKVMREMAEQGGLRFNADVREAMARIEAGVDPEKIDEQFKEVFDLENPFESDSGTKAAKNAAQEFLRRLCPPRRDPKWYDMTGEKTHNDD